jgi:hypothetical protein
MSTLDDITQLTSFHKQAQDPNVAHLVIGRNEVVSSRTLPGLDVDVEERDEGVTIVVNLAPETRIDKPVHMCFGMLQEEGIQEIDIEMVVGDGASMDVMAHCVFPNAQKIRHLMDGRIRIGSGAHYSYIERHIHAETGGVEVVPKSTIVLGDDSRFKTDFELLHGRVGLIDIAYDVTCGARSVLEMNARVSGKADDVIKIGEIGHLAGEHSRGALTSRVAVRDNARADIYNKLTASAAYARGHVDCKEIVQGEAIAAATPVVEVTHPKAHVTHEAALGSVDNKQLETLMARGLTEDEASDLIIEGLLS